MFDRRRFLTGALAAAAFTGSSSLFGIPRQNQAVPAEPDLDWHDAEEWGVEGRGWPTSEMKRFFDRLPGRAEGVVRKEVWNLSRDSAGMLTRFTTDSPEIHVDYTLFRERLALPHMPATGVSGLDLYGDASGGQWRWVAVMRPQEQRVRGLLIKELDGTERRYTLYLPLYNGVDSLKVGILKGARFSPVKPREDAPIVFYGTSITHGACASRPGMAHPSILGRRLNRPVVNLGFSGNGRMEKEVGSFLAELNAAVYVIDCLPNMNGEQVLERAEPLVGQLREARPRTPVVLVEDRSFTNSWIRPSARAHHEASRAALRQVYRKLSKSGIKGLFYLEGARLLGDDSEGSTDGSHPSDLGFMRQADRFEPVLRKALKWGRVG